MLINLDFAGNINTRADNVLLFGKSNTIIRDLCREIGWEDVLDHEWAKTALACTAGKLCYPYCCCVCPRRRGSGPERG